MDLPGSILILLSSLVYLACRRATFLLYHTTRQHNFASLLSTCHLSRPLSACPYPLKSGSFHFLPPSSFHLSKHIGFENYGFHP